MSPALAVTLVHLQLTDFLENFTCDTSVLCCIAGDFLLILLSALQQKRR